MKKFNLFKVVMSTLLAVLVLTWIIPASSYDGSTVTGTAITVVPIMDLFSNMINTVSYFSQIAIFAIVVGGFYGILNITDAYSVLLQKVAKYFKGKEKQFIVVTILIFEILAAIINLPFVLFVFVPMFASIILLLGYNKITALLSTIGAISIGFIGSIYSYILISPAMTTTSELTTTSDIIAKIALLALGAVLLIMYTFKGMRKVSAKSKEKIEDPFYVEVKKPTVKLLAMKIVLGLTSLITVLGFIDWTKLFAIENFTEMYNDFIALKLFGFPIMQNLFGSIAVFGSWSYIDIAMTLIVVTLILALIYKVKINEYLNALFDGMNKMIPTAGLLILAFSVLVLSNSTSQYSLVGIVPAFFDFFIGFTDNFNIILMIIPTLFAAIMSVDLYYFIQFSFPIAKTLVNDPAIESVMALFFQTMYGFATLFAPTSLILLAGLSYLDVSYTKWIKYIAKLLLQLFIVILAVLVLVMVF